MFRFIFITVAIWCVSLQHVIASADNIGIRPVALIPKTKNKLHRSIIPASPSTLAPSSTATTLPPHGGSLSTKPPPSIYWAVLHNWLYFLSLGLNAVNIKFLIREIIDGSTTTKPSPQAVALSGKVESVDKFLTFAGIGFLSALSDKIGRRPLMIWSALGFGVTNLIQAQAGSAGNSVAVLYLADFIDGCSSCMLPLCQAYIADVSSSESLAANLGVFQGLSAGGAFIIAFPVGGIVGAKYGPRVPLFLAAAIQALNALILLLFTPESNPPQPAGTKLNLVEANPIRGLKRLFGNAPILRTASILYFLVALARSSLDAQFSNYSSIRFGWTQAQSGPVLVMVGLMLAIAPRIFVPLFGLKNSILSGILILAIGLTGAGLAPTPTPFISSIAIVSIGCVCVPALTALLANLAPAGQKGALLGAVGSLTELTGGIGSTMYAEILGKFMTKDNAPMGLDLPGMHFLVGAGILVVAWGIGVRGFRGELGGHVAFKSGMR